MVIEQTVPGFTDIWPGGKARLIHQRRAVVVFPEQNPVEFDYDDIALMLINDGKRGETNDLGQRVDMIRVPNHIASIYGVL